MAHTVQHLLSKKNVNGVISVKQDATVYEALEIMGKHNIGCLLIMEGNELKGIFSERDYARKGIIAGRKAKSTPISEIMTPNVITVDTSMNTKDCMEIMSARKFRHLPVVDNNKKVVGLLSIGDIVNAVLNEQKEHIKYLESYIGS